MSTLGALAPQLRRWIWLLLGLLLALLLACQQQSSEGVLPGGPAPTVETPVISELSLNPGELPKGKVRLVVGQVPFVGNRLLLAQYEPIARYLTEVLDFPVEIKVGDSYEHLIDLVANKEVDIVSLPPLSYVLAKERVPDLQLLASQLALGSTSYSSYVIVRADHPAESIYDLVGGTIAFVDEFSTSGFLLPYAAFLEMGFDPERAFKQKFFGSHSKVIEAVALGYADAGATGSGMRRAALHDQGINKKVRAVQFRLLYKAGRMPYDAVCAQGYLSESAKRKIAGAFISLNTRSEKGRRVLGNAIDISGWMPVDEYQYTNTRNMLGKVRAHRKKSGIATKLRVKEPEMP